MNITVQNILQTQPLQLAEWVSQNLLDVRLPVPGSNSSLNVHTDVVPLLPVIANKMAVCTELYNMCIGAKAPWSVAKRISERKAEAENNVTTLSAHIDILYRTIQTLDALRETASRMVTSANQAIRLNQ
jgi:hypothetical protein